MTFRLLLAGILTLSLYYALFGGEYSVGDMRRIQKASDEAASVLAVRTAEMEARAAWADSLEQDPRVLEGLARERFGMIRPGEILYRFAEPLDGVEEVDTDPGRD
jgi:cell division protein FtsB